MPSLVRRLAPGIAAVIVGLALLVGFAVLSDHYARDSDELRASGSRVQGTVFLLNADSRYSSGSAVIE
jgi:hypothetical protein